MIKRNDIEFTSADKTMVACILLIVLVPWVFGLFLLYDILGNWGLLWESLGLK